MEKTLRAGDRIRFSDFYNNLYSSKPIDLYLYPILILLTVSKEIIVAHSLGGSIFSKWPTFSLTIFLCVLSRLLTIQNILVTEENLLRTDYSYRISKINPISSIKSIKLIQKNWLVKYFNLGTVIIETEDENITLKWYSRSRQLTNLIEMIQKNQKLAEN